MNIRWYQPEDDPYLMEIERLSPRGEPRPFVHFRRRFVDRADLYSQPYVFIAEHEGIPIGVTSIALKDTFIGDEAVRVAYSFDTRIHPKYRRQGVATALQEEKLHFLRTNGIHAIYTFIVSTNYASLNMLEKLGFQRSRLILYMTFPPYPLILPPDDMPVVSNDWSYYDPVLAHNNQNDLFVDDVAVRVAEYGFGQVCVDVGGRHFASLSFYDQSRVYQQVSADEPWPTEAEMNRRARTLHIFDEVGINHPDQLHAAFDYVRDIAVTSNVSKLAWVIDRAKAVPTFVFEEATYQIDYWMLVHSIMPDWEPQWNGKPIYIDARDL